MKVVKGNFGEGKGKAPAEGKAQEEVLFEHKLVDFAKAKEEMEEETKGDRALDDFL